MHFTETATNGAVLGVQTEPNNLSWFSRDGALLFLASFVALYFELVVIRYLSSEIRVFAYLKNLALIASFFGIGLGMVLERPPKVLQRFFALITAALFLLITFASFLKLTHVTAPTFDYRMLGDMPTAPTGHWLVLWELMMVLIYLAVVPAIMFLVVGFFVVLGGLVGQHLVRFPSLKAYGVNLGGSLAGIAAFTILSVLGTTPVVWVLVGFLCLVPFFFRQRWSLVFFALIAGAMAAPQAHVYWSPYYRISTTEIPPPAGWPHPVAYQVNVNYDFHQIMLDLSPEFTGRFPDVEPNKSAKPMYELPYRLVPNPGRVLIVGAGTGNDVAAALRHGATHVDAVEIDPFILRLGRKYHPEHPYDSPRVTVTVTDARAFFKKATQKYDLIVFGFLDSHTMVTGFSSIRLDNYVYTLESFRQARSLLAPDGTLVLAFSGGRTFISDRLYGTLTRAFDAAPRAYFTGGGWAGVVFVEGKGAEPDLSGEFPDISKDLQSHQADAIVATDHWPFLYLKSRTLPFAIWSVLVLFLYFAATVLQRVVSIKRLASRQGLHLFFLGAGFMLLETRGITELSLLFGSTWIVNAVVITAFLVMGLLANSLVMFRPVSRRVAYSLLFAILAAGMFVPYSVFGALSPVAGVVAASVLAGLPVFFSGIIFSRSFLDVTHPAQGLGINLLGAVAGGALENLVMVGGTPILGLLVILVYGLSAVLIPKDSARQEDLIAPYGDVPNLPKPNHP